VTIEVLVGRRADILLGEKNASRGSKIFSANGHLPSKIPGYALGIGNKILSMYIIVIVCTFNGNDPWNMCLFNVLQQPSRKILSSSIDSQGIIKI
jgi:hypothetical protein